MNSGEGTLEEVLSGHARWCVLVGDNADFFPLIPNLSVDHVITDPPYETEAHTKQRRLTDPDKVSVLDFAKITEFQRDWVGRDIRRVTKRWALVFCQVEAAMSWRNSLVEMAYKRTGIWVKTAPMPQLSGDRPAMGYESIVIAHGPGRSRWNGGGKPAVWECGRDYAAQHPTTKPLPLMLELVASFTDPDDLILDPFAGSGTTGVAALRHGRRCILIEKDPKYADLCRERILAEATNNTVLGLRAKQVPLFQSYAA